jgi:hypothetical protein
MRASPVDDPPAPTEMPGGGAAMPARSAFAALRRRRWRRIGAVVGLVVLAHLGLLEQVGLGAGPVNRRVGVQAITVRQLPPDAQGRPSVPTAPATETATDASPARARANTGADEVPADPTSGPPADMAAPAAAADPPAPMANQAAASGAAATETAGSDASGGPDAAAPGLTRPAGTLPAGGRLPVYATALPPSASLHFSIRRGASQGRAELDWRRDGAGYRLHLLAEVFGRPMVEQLSRGKVDIAGIAPERYADQRRGRDLRAANFRRDIGRISFSGPTVQYPLLPGAQDRLSWLIQLSAIAQAARQAESPLAIGSEIALMVADARGVAAIWSLVVVGTELLDTAAGPVPALHLTREPVHPYDLRIDVWLDPAAHHLPLRWQQTVMPGGEELRFERDALDFTDAPPP